MRDAVEASLRASEHRLKPRTVAGYRGTPARRVEPGVRLRAATPAGADQPVPRRRAARTRRGVRTGAAHPDLSRRARRPPRHHPTSGLIVRATAYTGIRAGELAEVDAVDPPDPAASLSGRAARPAPGPTPARRPPGRGAVPGPQQGPRQPRLHPPVRLLHLLPPPLQPALSDLGLPDTRFHDLRHYPAAPWLTPESRSSRSASGRQRRDHRPDIWRPAAPRRHPPPAAHRALPQAGCMSPPTTPEQSPPLEGIRRG